MSDSKTYSLFGGAISIALPPNLIDASDLRQVPDTQEVLLSPTSDASVVIEVLECVEPNDPNEIAKFHFDSLIHDNDATPEFCTIEEVTTPNGPLVLSVLRGTQLVPKFNSTKPDTVKTFLAVYRVHEKAVDIVLVISIPVETEKEGGAVPLGGDVYKAWVKGFEDAVTSFSIVDYGLFA